jgi:hypothetical protein
MALTMEELRKLVEGQKLRYFLDPNRDALMLGAAGVNGRYQFVILLEVDGQFVQFRTVGYLHTRTDHPHVHEVLEVLGALNYKLRLVKFGWDPSDGEIVGYADVWVMDGDLTPAQFKRMIGNYLSAIDINYARIKKTMETGKDPGDERPVIPPELQKIIDDLLRAKKEGAKKQGAKKEEVKKKGAKKKAPEVTHI